MPRLLALVLGLCCGGLALTTCQRTSPAAMDTSAPETAKMDAALRQEIASVPADREFQVLLELGEVDFPKVRADLEALGLRVGTLSGRIATATGTPAAVRAVAARPWVRRLELSQVRPATPD